MAGTKKSWGTGTPPRDVIAVTALALIDTGGLADFSMRKLAAEMGIHVNALYRRVANRDELLDLVGDAVIGEVVVPEPGAAWAAFLVALGADIRRVILGHPQTSPLINTMTSGTPSLMALENAVFGALMSAGFHGPDLLLAHNTYLGYVLGTSVVEAMQRPEGSAARPDAASLTPEERAAYPSLSKASDEIAPLAGTDDEDLFRAGVDAVLRGLQKSARKRR